MMAVSTLAASMEHQFKILEERVKSISLTEPGYVFLIFEDDESKGFLHFCIALSTNPQAHLSKLQRGNPRKLYTEEDSMIEVTSMEAAGKAAKLEFAKTECEQREDGGWYVVELKQKNDTVRKFITATNGDGKGFIYMIEESDVTNPQASIHITIGRSVSPGEHLQMLQKGNPRKLVFACSSVEVKNMQFTAQVVKNTLFKKYRYEQRGGDEWLIVNPKEKEDVISQFNSVVKDPYGAIKDCGDEQGYVYLAVGTDDADPTAVFFYIEHSVSPDLTPPTENFAITCKVEVKSIKLALEAAKAAFCEYQGNQKGGKKLYKLPPQQEKTSITEIFRKAVESVDPHGFQMHKVAVRERDDVNGYVYLIKEKNISGPYHYMVGHSVHPDDCLITLQKGNPRELSFVHKIPVCDMKAADEAAQFSLCEYNSVLGGGIGWFTATLENEKHTLIQKFLASANIYRC